MAKDLFHVFQAEDGCHWFDSHSQGVFRYSIVDDAAFDQEAVSKWYKKEIGIGDLNGRKQGDYEIFISSTQGNDGALWIANLDGMVWRYDGNAMTQYPVMENGEHHWIFSIYRDKQDVLSLGTQANGVYRFDGKSFQKFSP
jgi:ligand-binding sensor domain-containing protein